MIDKPVLQPCVQVFRAPQKGSQSLLIVSPAWVAHSTHFTRRTRLCPGEDRCPLCGESVLPRWLAWIAAVAPGVQEPGLLEMTSYVADQVASHANNQENLTGVVLRITRGRRAWPECTDFAQQAVGEKWIRDTAWVQRQVRRLLSVPDTDTWRDAAAALLRHDINHGHLANCGA